MAGALREVFARFAIEVDDTKLDKLNQKTTDGAKKLEGWGKTLAKIAAGVGIVGFVHHITEVGSAIEDNSKRLGISSDAYQQLGFAAQQTGASVEEMSTALLIMQDKLASGDKAFSALGVSTKDASGKIRDTEEVFADAAEAISKLKDPAKQTEAAVNLFGRSGRRLLPMLKDGRAGLAKMREEAIKLGGGFDKAAVAASDDFGDAIDRLKFLGTSFAGRIASWLLPQLSKVAAVAQSIGVWFLKIEKDTRILQSALIVLGGIAAGFAATSVAPFVLWGVLIGGLILLFEDLWGTFEGKDSLIREIVDGFLGLGATEEIVEKLKVAWVSIVEAIKDAVKWVGDFISGVERAYRKSRELLGLGNEEEGPKSSRIGVNHYTKEEQQDAMRLAAARAGQTIRFKGETKAQADAAMRAAQATLNANIVINGVGDGKEAAKALREELERLNASINRAAAQALTREAPAE